MSGFSKSTLIGLALFPLNIHNLNIAIFFDFVSSIIPFTMYIFLDFDQLHIDNIIHAALISFDDNTHIRGHLR